MSDKCGMGQAAGMDRRTAMRLLGAAAVGVNGLFSMIAPGVATATPRVASADKSLSWPPAGAFGGKAIVGPHQPSAELMLDTAELLGLPPQMSFIYGCLRDSDGNMSEWVRNFNLQPDAARQGLFVQSNLGKDALRVAPDIFMAAAAEVVASNEGGNGIWRSPDGAKGKPYELTMSADGGTIHWTEAGALDVTGTLMGPGLQWYIAEPSGSELYVSQIYEMKGVALGKPVHGVMAFDKAYLPKGIRMYGGKDPLFRPKEHHRTWYTWGTRYKDGSYDAGHFVLGTDRIGFALLTNERGQLVLDTNVTGRVELLSNEPWPKRVSVRTSSGAEWEFIPDQQGHMPDMLGTGATTAFTPQTEGRWRRLGDRREPEAWFAWGEVAERGRIDQAWNYRF
ncbi:hypothetical protein [Paraburkholderia sp. MM5384-R2]|uniref:hypothetical protein n=1 Tax=Paraburkholderia sp. MM5384-R2 TaxID=2723097 RepID=UPI00160E23B5|nr:hypothetical protein [Paraburkholderia sp. MM5384-R2]MBB5498659.1 hypothetical protein [Paraburkholderia sp. MM5384-R2]